MTHKEDEVTMSIETYKSLVRELKWLGFNVGFFLGALFGMVFGTVYTQLF